MITTFVEIELSAGNGDESIPGIDYAGPFTLKRGHTRKPVLVKSYTALFV